MALDLAFDFKDTQADLWNKISRDKYMVYAVKECYHSVERILLSLLDNEGRLWYFYIILNVSLIRFFMEIIVMS